MSDKNPKDEQGAKAPDQADQAITNEKRKTDEKSGKVEQDPRWPAMGSGMTVVPPSNEEEAKKLNAHNEELRKAASKNADKLAVTSDKK